MIAHSFKGEVFGPAQALHGATFTVAVAFMSEKLDQNGIVVDIGSAIGLLKATLKVVNYKNLDDIPQFKGVNTTTEWLTRWVFDQFVRAGTPRRCAEGPPDRDRRTGIWRSSGGGRNAQRHPSADRAGASSARARDRAHARRSRGAARERAPRPVLCARGRGEQRHDG